MTVRCMTAVRHGPRDGKADYPSPRPKKTLPVRSVCMLLLCNDAAEVLLEKRPPAGIWGGLWSFPELRAEDVPAVWCRDKLGITAAEIDRWPVMRHTFSHFHLDITPLLLRANDASNSCNGRQGAALV